MEGRIDLHAQVLFLEEGEGVGETAGQAVDLPLTTHPKGCVSSVRPLSPVLSIRFIFAARAEVPRIHDQNKTDNEFDLFKMKVVSCKGFPG